MGGVEILFASLLPTAWPGAGEIEPRDQGRQTLKAAGMDRKVRY